MAREGLGVTEAFAASVTHAKKQCSLQLVLIATDQVAPLAQQEVCKIEIEGDAAAWLANLANTIRPSVETKGGQS